MLIIKMVKYMKKNNIFIISIIVVILVSLCTIAGTYAVIINVTNENGTDKIINNITILKFRRGLSNIV